ncbi:PIG-L deacetylase family protein [Parapedobacter indicus]|uniref:N-acetylglucosaminyl deacetylase, LmbE family n=1 Tax=Parapedobacter indicus TaxID=1477437 RepID=A0A1I3FUX7_9SPHI|nr:PIG-L family deacetylase [Parapedobacter indicus]PPL03899.1 LmbE family N-acetylglucosaminyl deacetylase [Parapedobacter indicus]SFI15009.1 N-acetylglucosaminyl deacetylase, LmbE family [Parapedobacter indicus]
MKENVNNTVLAIVAHPDDAELLCAGTLALLKDKGWRVEMATMTPGDGGTVTLSREEISAVRKREAASAAALLEAPYQCLECEDIFVMYDKPTLLKVIELIRRTRPRMVFTMSPSCYMVDHEMTSKLVQTACFSAGVKNIETASPPFFFTPYLYYADAMEGKDRYGAEVVPGMVVDITDKIALKEQMLACHESQRNWLREHHGMDEYLLAMRAFSAKRGEAVRVRYGEGFRQHLGHAFPQENLLEAELENYVK